MSRMRGQLACPGLRGAWASNGPRLLDQCEGAGIALIEDAVPDESTILRFRHLLERDLLMQMIFELVGGLLEQKRLLLTSGTIMDATKSTRRPRPRARPNPVPRR